MAKPRTEPSAQITDLLRNAQQSQNGANSMGGIVTAAMLAAAGSDCECESCKLLRKMSKQLRQSMLEG